MQKSFQPGQPVIGRVSKHSPQPGPRARDISPASRGDNYTYDVPKFWRVVEQVDARHVRVRTRRGKQRIVPANGIELRKARWWERVIYRARFPEL